MSKPKNSSVIFYVFLLLSLFLSGFSGVVILDHVFDGLIGRLDRQAANQRARMAIGQVIVSDLKDLQSEFLQLATTASPKARETAVKRLKIRLGHIEQTLVLLEKGGTLEQRILLNLGERDEMLRKFHYRPSEDQQIILEVVNLRPKLMDLEQMTEQLSRMVAQRHEAREAGDALQVARTVDRVLSFLKTPPPQFLRMTENANKLFFDSSNRLAEIESECEIKKKRYLLIEAGIVIGVFLLTLGLGALIVRNVRRILVDQKRAETEVRANEERLRTILDTVQTGVVVIDAKTHTITEANPAALKMMEAEKEAVIGAICHSFICPVKEGQCPITDHHETIDNSEQTLLKPGGTRIPILKNAVAFTMYDRQYILESFVDISERQRTQEILEQHNHFLRTIIESLTHPFYVVDMENYNVVLANSAARGGAMSEAHTCYQLTHDRNTPCDGKDHLCPLRKVRQTRGEVTMEHLHVDAEGRPRTVEVHGYPVFDESGAVRQMIEYSIDITERKEAEEEINKLYRAVEQSPATVVITDTEGIIEYVNPRFTQLTGYTLKEAIGQNPRILKSDTMSPDVYKTLWDTIKGGGEWRGEFLNKKKSGDLFWEEAHISPIFDKDDNMTHFLAIKQDITERKETLNALEAAKEAAQAANVSKSEFLANMSHEIRTPMNAVIGMTSLLLDTPLEAEQADYMETIRGSGEALLTIINDILDFSKIEAGKLALENSTFNLRSCVEEALDLLAQKAVENNIELVFYMEDKVPEGIWGDVTRLRQVLVNLLSNAAKFTPSGEIFVHVRKLSDNGGPTLQISVTDTGIGIPKDRRDSLFQPFSQVDASTTRKFGGTGLGLTISKQLCQKMGGDMWVESEEGGGSTFHFTIRADVAPLPDCPDQKEDAGKLRGRRLLMVADSPHKRLVLSGYASRWDMAPVIVKANRDALDLIKKGDSFDATLLDMQLQNPDITEVVDEIGKLPRAGKPPLILLSVLGREKNMGQGLFAACVSKPIKPSRLLSAILQVLDPNSREQQPSAPTHSTLTPELAKTHPLRILLAEDNIVNQKVATHMLKKMGYRADVAATGKEAVAAVKRQAYDVVFMDIQMPEMDGVAATHYIRRNLPLQRQPRIIAMTAHAMSGDREKYLKEGMDDYVSKPVRPDDLRKALLRTVPLEL